MTEAVTAADQGARQAGRGPRSRAARATTGPAHRRRRPAGARRRRRRGAVGRRRRRARSASRSNHVMAGYWDRPDETAAALAGGWLHTGTSPSVDPDGYVTHRRPQEGPHRHRRREHLVGRGREDRSPPTRRCSRSPWSACPTSAGARCPGRSSCSARGGRHRRRRLIAHVQPHLAGFKAPKDVVFVDALPAAAPARC